jgi:glycosyltransferase involved in cell wall biosynthesis
MADLKVSVCVVTYNQEQYIGQCLQSLVDQETDFAFEIVVSDDNSTDRTSDIVCEYGLRYPEIIRPIVNKTNVGPFTNYLNVHKEARAPYIAHMDGDDYALPGKLAKQAKFLDEHPECALVFHRCFVLSRNGVMTPSSTKVYKGSYNVPDYLYLNSWNKIHSSKMYRAAANSQLWKQEKEWIDLHIHLMHGLSGLASLIEEELGVYREGIGIAAGGSYGYRLLSRVLDACEYAKELNYDGESVKRFAAKTRFETACHCLTNKHYQEFREYVELAFNDGYATKSVYLAYYLRRWPSAYIFAKNSLRSISRIVGRAARFIHQRGP